jgi:hypothetical protein
MKQVGNNDHYYIWLITNRRRELFLAIEGISFFLCSMPILFIYPFQSLVAQTCVVWQFL